MKYSLVKITEVDGEILYGYKQSEKLSAFEYMDEDGENFTVGNHEYEVLVQSEDFPNDDGFCEFVEMNPRP